MTKLACLTTLFGFEADANPGYEGKGGGMCIVLENIASIYIHGSMVVEYD